MNNNINITEMFTLETFLGLKAACESFFNEIGVDKSSNSAHFDFPINNNNVLRVYIQKEIGTVHIHISESELSQEDLISNEIEDEGED